MSIEQIIVLALIQGITEFLPISSSGHLILVPALTGWQDQGVEFLAEPPEACLPIRRGLAMPGLADCVAAEPVA